MSALKQDKLENMNLIMWLLIASLVVVKGRILKSYAKGLTTRDMEIQVTIMRIDVVQV